MLKKRITIFILISVILVFIIIVIRAILPRFDFMYTSADKHWQKEKISDWDEKKGGTEIEKVIKEYGKISFRKLFEVL